MWNAALNTIPKEQILQAHLRVLSEAVKDAEMYDIRSSAVYDALDWIKEEYPHTRWPCCQFRNALEDWSPQFLHSAWYALQKSLSITTNDI
tara:strand:+ start:124 stop:396 length:273 start_codon:yes stop_codon:yes gene_type:complete